MDWIAIRKEYESTEISLSDLAVKYGIKYSTVKSRNQREKWKKDASKGTSNDASKKKQDATKKVKEKREPRRRTVTNSELEISPELTEKQKLFCLYYIKNHNATMSAIKAGYAKDSAHVQGHDNLRIPKVSAEIKRLKGNLVQDLYLDARDVLEVYIKIALADPTDYIEFGTNKEYVYVEGRRMVGVYGEYLTQDVNYVRIKNHDEVDGSMISEIKQGKEGISIKFHDKHKALEVLKEYFDLTPDQHKRKLEDANLELSKRRVVVTESELELRKKESERKDF